MQNKNTVIPLSYCEDKEIALLVSLIQMPASPHPPYINAEHILQLFGLILVWVPQQNPSGHRGNAQSTGWGTQWGFQSASDHQLPTLRVV